MQPWARLWLICSAGHVFRARARLRGPDESIIHRLRPGLPTAQQSSDLAANSDLVAAFSAGEARTESDELEAAGAMQTALRAQLAASETEVATQEAATAAGLAARRVEKLQRQTAEVAAAAQEYAAMIPEVTRRAAARAVAEVEAETTRKLNGEVAKVVADAQGTEDMLKQLAADQAQAAALPFQEAKLRATQTMWSYLSKGRELAKAVTELKEKAVEIAQVAVPLQEKGNPVAAQQLQMQAHDLMDKALQMEAQAKSLQGAADKIRRGLGAFDGAATSAATYGAYQANPASLDRSPPIPQPPFPLSLPPMPLRPAAVGSPAPAPAAPALAAPPWLSL